MSVSQASIKMFGTNECLPKYIRLMSKGFMRLRNCPCILRIHSSKKKKDKEEGIYSELLLYLPWRSEIKLRKHLQHLFTAEYDTIDQNKRII